MYFRLGDSVVDSWTTYVYWISRFLGVGAVNIYLGDGGDSVHVIVGSDLVHPWLVGFVGRRARLCIGV